MNNVDRGCRRELEVAIDAEREREREKTKMKKEGRKQALGGEEGKKREDDAWFWSMSENERDEDRYLEKREPPNGTRREKGKGGEGGKEGRKKAIEEN